MPQTINPSLTQHQADEYHKQGFVLVPDVFGLQELDRINADLDAILKNKTSNGKEDPEYRPGWINALGRQSELARKICRDERLLDLIAPLVRPGIAIYSAKLATKEPFDTIICHWHQDDAYYSNVSESDCRLSAYVALNDITPDMGCLQVIPRSHHAGLEQYTAQGSGACRLALTSPPDLSQAQYVPMTAGSVLLFSALLHHGSGTNPTHRRRRAFIISYQEATAAAGNGKQWKILRPA